MSEHTVPIPTGHDSAGPVNDTKVKIGHLVTGLVFLGLAGTWALRASGAIDDVTVGWLLPAILVAAGVIGLLAMLASSLGNPRAARRRDRSASDGPTYRAPEPDQTIQDGQPDNHHEEEQ